MPAEAFKKRLLWIYGSLTLYLLVASLLAIVGWLYLPLRMDIGLLSAWLALYFVIVFPRFVKKRQKQANPAESV